MTIELQTGLPGHCKTLYTLDRIERLHKQTGRPVFFNGINIYRSLNEDGTGRLDDKGPRPAPLAHWQEIEGDKWYTAPPEAIVVIDECQRIFRPRPNGSVVPKHESELETHRHGGIDLILLTQKPRLVSVGVRELVGRHLHAVRRFGTQTSTIHEWPELRFNVQSRKDSQKSVYKFNKEVFGWYKSAEAHTVKRAIPLKVFVMLAMFLLIPVLLAVIGWRLKHQFTGEAQKDALASSATTKGAASSSPSGGSSRSQSETRPQGQRSAGLSPVEYLAAQAPRVPGLAYTAPAYDEVTRVVEAPYPAACVASQSRGCRCYTQQGTRLDVPAQMCAAIAEGGFFVAWAQRVAPAVPIQAAQIGSQAPQPIVAGFGFSRPAPQPSPSILPASDTDSLPLGRGKNLPPAKPAPAGG